MASLIDLMRMLEMVSQETGGTQYGPGTPPAFGVDLARRFGLENSPPLSIQQAPPAMMVSPGTGGLNEFMPKTQDQQITDFLMRNGTLYPRDPQGKSGNMDMGLNIMGMGAGMMQQGENETAQRQAEANAFAQQQLSNQMNMMRANQANPGDSQALLKAVSEGPGYADAALGPGGTGTAQPFTPKLNPRFESPWHGRARRLPEAISEGGTMRSDRGLVPYLRMAMGPEEAMEEVVVTARPRPWAPIDPAQLYGRTPAPQRQRMDDAVLRGIEADAFAQQQQDRLDSQINMTRLLEMMRRSQAKQELPRRFRALPEINPSYVRGGR